LFDIYLPVVALSPARAHLLPPQPDPGFAAILGSFFFVTALLGRAIGALMSALSPVGSLRGAAAAT
jgi:hypothetical protein